LKIEYSKIKVATVAGLAPHFIGRTLKKFMGFISLKKFCVDCINELLTINTKSSETKELFNIFILLKKDTPKITNNTAKKNLLCNIQKLHKLHINLFH
jgi:hypothetical protein